MLDGRVKTLHPKVHGGILARRDAPGARRRRSNEHAIPTIDLVVVNLYPFRETVAEAGLHARRRDREHRHRRPDDGARGGEELAARRRRRRSGRLRGARSRSSRRNGAVLSTRRASRSRARRSRTPPSYDGAISNWLTARGADGAAAAFPDRFNLQAIKVQDLRYGENPHQPAAFYRDESPAAGHHRDVPAAAGQGAVVQQHRRRRRRVGVREDVRRARLRDRQARQSVRRGDRGDPARTPTASAFATDPTSAFGGIIAFNRPVDAATLEAVAAQFLEVLIAPAYTADALAVIAQKKNVRVLEVPVAAAPSPAQLDFKRVGGGLLVQTRRRPQRAACGAQGRHASARRRRRELADLLFAWRVAKFVKSNAIVYCRGGPHARHRRRPDEPRRLDAHRRDQGASTRTCRSPARSSRPMRSFRFATASTSSPTTAPTAVIQPGGSMRDDEVIAAADERGIAMVFTGMRHFRH